MLVEKVAPVGGWNAGASRRDRGRAPSPQARTPSAVAAEPTSLGSAVARARDAEAAARAAHLQAIAVAVRDGAYRVDAVRVADAVLDDAAVIARVRQLTEGRSSS